MGKRTFSIILALLVVLLWGVGTAEGAGTKRLELAFGLFSVEVPADAAVGPNTGNALSDLRYEVRPFPGIVYANFAPRAEYADTAERRLNSYISLLFVLCGDGYSETEVAEEALPGGVRLRWQLMRGDSAHALWFEAFSKEFGYNMCLSGPPDDEQDARMLALMRSFRADQNREGDLMRIRQQKREDGSFVSAEHGLSIRLDADWNAVTMEDMLLPQTAFVLEKGGGQWLIQLMYAHPVPPDGARDLLDWFVQSARRTDPFGNAPTFGEPYSVALDGLGGIEAWVVEEESDIFLRNIAFVHESYGYFGSFMWIKELDGVARPQMDAALRSLTVPD
ncbi:MAG: hypothetical protein GX592_06850 [Clostridiales bacterium]|nr:hypothetical protein [Clostridiales bacterium]